MTEAVSAVGRAGRAGGRWAMGVLARRRGADSRRTLGAGGRAGRWAPLRAGRAGVGAADARPGRWALPGRAGWPMLCTWCTQPVFGPVRLGIFPGSTFGHCS